MAKNEINCREVIEGLVKLIFALGWSVFITSVLVVWFMHFVKTNYAFGELLWYGWAGMFAISQFVRGIFFPYREN